MYCVLLMLNCVFNCECDETRYSMNRPPFSVKEVFFVFSPPKRVANIMKKEK